MNFAMKARGLGASFKGIANYLMNPKREDVAEAAQRGEPANDRAGFSMCFNLPTDDVSKAWRIMAKTALHRDELKAAAGVSAAGRKVKAEDFKPVYHYALSWHPDQKPTDEEMKRAALDSLKAQKLDHLQAFIVQHTDADHMHVHVVVNRVDPETGKVVSLSNNQRALDRFCYDYERASGQIVSPNRDAKFQALDADQQPTPKTGKEWLPHHLWVQQREAQRIEKAAGFKVEAGELYDSQKAARDELYEQAKGEARKVAQHVRSEHRGEWSTLGRQQRREYRGYAWATEKHAHMVAFVNENRDRLLSTFKDTDEAQERWGDLLTPAGLRAALDRAQAADTANLKGKVQDAQHAAQREFWGGYREQVEELRDQQTGERAQLRRDQRAGVADRATTTQINPPKIEAANRPAERQEPGKIEPQQPGKDETQRPTYRPGVGVRGVDRYGVLREAAKPFDDRLAAARSGTAKPERAPQQPDPVKEQADEFEKRLAMARDRARQRQRDREPER